MDECARCGRPEEEYGGGFDIGTHQIQTKTINGMTHLMESFIGENNGNEHRKALLREAGDVANQCREVKHHHQKQDQTHPHSNPESEHHEIPSIGSVRELEQNMISS